MQRASGLYLYLTQIQKANFPVYIPEIPAFVNLDKSDNKYQQRTTGVSDEQQIQATNSSYKRRTAGINRQKGIGLNYVIPESSPLASHSSISENYRYHQNIPGNPPGRNIYQSSPLLFRGLLPCMQ